MPCPARSTALRSTKRSCNKKGTRICVFSSESFLCSSPSLASTLVIWRPSLRERILSILVTKPQRAARMTRSVGPTPFVSKASAPSHAKEMRIVRVLSFVWRPAASKRSVFHVKRPASVHNVALVWGLVVWLVVALRIVVAVISVQGGLASRFEPAQTEEEGVASLSANGHDLPLSSRREVLPCWDCSSSASFAWT